MDKLSLVGGSARVYISDHTSDGAVLGKTRGRSAVVDMAISDGSDEVLLVYRNERPASQRKRIRGFMRRQG